MQEIQTHAIIYYISSVPPTNDSPLDELTKRTLKREMPWENITATKTIDEDTKRWQDGGKHYIKDALEEESDRYRVVIIDDDGQSTMKDYDIVSGVVSGMEYEVWVFPELALISHGFENPSEK